MYVKQKFQRSEFYYMLYQLCVPEKWNHLLNIWNSRSNIIRYPLYSIIFTLIGFIIDN